MRKKIVIKICLLLSWMLFIFVALSIPMHGANINSGIEKITIYDKVIHVVLFGIFNWLLLNLLVEFKRLKYRFIIYISILSGFFYVFICEYMQIFIDGRHSSVLDLFSGIAGIIISLIYWFKKQNIYDRF